MHHIGRYYTYESLYTLMLTYIPTNVPIRFLRVYLHIVRTNRSKMLLLLLTQVLLQLLLQHLCQYVATFVP